LTCSLDQDAALRRAGWIGATALVVAGVAGAIPLAPLSPGLAVLTVVASGLAAATCRALRQTLTRRALRRKRSALVLDGASLTIAQGLPEEDDWRGQRGGYVNRSRGEPPQVPFYQRTYSGL